MTDALKLARKIDATIHCQEQMVFLYEKDGGGTVTRFVMPLALEKTMVPCATIPGNMVSTDPEEWTVLCEQVLPKAGWRRFKLGRIKSEWRVMAKASL